MLAIDIRDFGSIGRSQLVVGKKGLVKHKEEFNPKINHYIPSKAYSWV